MSKSSKIQKNLELKNLENNFRARHCFTKKFRKFLKLEKCWNKFLSSGKIINEKFSVSLNEREFFDVLKFVQLANDKLAIRFELELSTSWETNKIWD